MLLLKPGELELVEVLRYLGVIFSSHVTRSDHIDQLSAMTNKRLDVLLCYLKFN